jgi:hypothetical protein
MGMKMLGIAIFYQGLKEYRKSPLPGRGKLSKLKG